MIDLNPHHLETVKRILAEHLPGREVRAFGSRATWTAKEHSDLDLVVMSSKPLDWNRQCLVSEAFEESDLPIRVDVVDWESLSDGFRQAIDEDCVVLQEGATSSGWREETIGDFCPFAYGKGLPARDRIPEGNVPVYGSNGIVGTHNRPLTNGPTVIVGRKGTIGSVHYSPIPCWPIDTTFYIADADPLRLRYKYYLLKSLRLDQMNADSAVPGLNRGDAHARVFQLPPLDEQKRIAGILGALDDKIELNRRMCQTLEAMAQALFKSWFVDFDPVRAKANGQPTNLPPEIDALFPDSFQQSELGEIPKGWAVRSLVDVVEAVRGRSYRSAELAESDTALVTLKSFARGGGYRTEGLKPYTGQYKPEQIIEPGELVIACTDVTQAAEVVGRPALVLPDRRFTTLVASLDTMIIRPLDRAATPVSFLYGLTSSHAFKSHTYAHVTGTTVLHLQKDAIPEFRFPMPPATLVCEYDACAGDISKRLANAHTDTASVVELLDRFLSNLIGDLP